MALTTKQTREPSPPISLVFDHDDTPHFTSLLRSKPGCQPTRSGIEPSMLTASAALPTRLSQCRPQSTPKPLPIEVRLEQNIAHLVILEGCPYILLLRPTSYHNDCWPLLRRNS